ncbi:hypothetical protein HMPREF9370_0284 [Neisseria wadsworthii 9715]|uniref:Uncharacterized protein n=1 Tax=Neisseria wadsworthii 9715 TaxID=1030841 RepID=G4CMH5_9NEIS|nr:hypothetical protein HMPREF9370_0284 [Neisseria wadsworthii 9715]
MDLQAKNESVNNVRIFYINLILAFFCYEKLHFKFESAPV